MFDSVLGTPKEKGIALHFRDDGGFQFRTLDIEDAFLVVKKDEKIVEAFEHKYKLLKRFNGFKNMGAGMVTITFGRDILLDLFSQLSPGEKPAKGADLRKDFVRKIAESKCYQHEHTKHNSLLLDKITMFVGATMSLLAVIIGISVAF